MNNRHPLATFFALAYAISWLIWAPLWLPAFGVHGLPVLCFHHALGALGPIAAAFLVSAMESGLAGPSDLLRRMGLWRGRFVWVAVALLAPYALLAFAVAGASVLGGQSVSLAGFGSSREFPQFSALAFLAYRPATPLWSPRFYLRWDGLSGTCRFSSIALATRAWMRQASPVGSSAC